LNQVNLEDASENFVSGTADEDEKAVTEVRATEVRATEVRY
jgi:hypothetical protein